MGPLNNSIRILIIQWLIIVLRSRLKIDWWSWNTYIKRFDIMRDNDCCVISVYKRVCVFTIVYISVVYVSEKIC